MDMEKLSKVAGILEDCTLEESGLLVREAIAEITDLHARVEKLTARVQTPSGLELAAIGRRHFGNPIPREWYEAARDLIAALSVTDEGRV